MPTNEPLAKPQSVAGEILVAGGVGIEGSDKFKIKVSRFRPDYFTRLEESTGDGDVNPFFEGSLYLYMNFILQGWVIATGAIGMSNLVVAAQNPLAAELKFTLASGHTLQFGALLEHIIIDWVATSPFIPLVITGQMHATDPTAAAFEVAP